MSAALLIPPAFIVASKGPIDGIRELVGEDSITAYDEESYVLKHIVFIDCAKNWFLAALYLAAIVYTGLEADNHLGSVSLSNPELWYGWQSELTYTVIKVLFQLSAVPFLPFTVGVMRTLFAHTAPTGYGRDGMVRHLDPNGLSAYVRWIEFTLWNPVRRAGVRLRQEDGEAYQRLLASIQDGKDLVAEIGPMPGPGGINRLRKQQTHIDQIFKKSGGLSGAMHDDDIQDLANKLVFAAKLATAGDGRPTLVGSEFELRALGASGTFLGWPRERFVAFCVASGCDYAKNVPGVGPARALALSAGAADAEVVLQRLLREPRCPEGFADAFRAAVRLFTAGD